MSSCVFADDHVGVAIIEKLIMGQYNEGTQESISLGTLRILEASTACRRRSALDDAERLGRCGSYGFFGVMTAPSASVDGGGSTGGRKEV
jgi:hypothetical protein